MHAAHRGDITASAPARKPAKHNSSPLAESAPVKTPPTTTKEAHAQSDGSEGNFLAVYEESLKKTLQEKTRLERQIMESENQLRQIEEDREKLQEQVRKLIAFFGAKGQELNSSFLVPIEREAAFKEEQAKKRASDALKLKDIRKSREDLLAKLNSKPDDSKPGGGGPNSPAVSTSPAPMLSHTHLSGGSPSPPASPKPVSLVSTHATSANPGARFRATHNQPAEMVKDTSTTEMLGSIFAMNKNYKRSVQELEELKAQDVTAELVESLVKRVEELKKQNEELRRTLQTSDDEAQFLDTLSEAVKICDSKDSIELMRLQKSKKGGKEEGKNLIKGGSMLIEYATATSVGNNNGEGPKTPKKLKEDKTKRPKKTKKDDKGKGSKKKGKHKKDDKEKGKKKKAKKDKTKKPKETPSEPNGEILTKAAEPEVVTIQIEEGPSNELSKTREAEILLKSYHEIAFEELQLDSTPLGNGAFGVVYKALWRGTEVAVKKLLVIKLNDTEIYNFKREAAFLERYSHHPNIVKFCGISTEFPNYAIITEFIEKGCIRDVLLKDQTIPWKRVMSMAVDAAAGVLHLHCEGIIHRDLALRNLLVGSDWRVRLADFGLARMMPKETYAKTRGNIGAVRWLAPEVLMDHVYSEKSDIYSFGIVMWELLTKKEPYEEMDNVLEVALGVMKRGLRPTVPIDCPPDYAQLMQDCWSQHPDDRPTMLVTHKRLKAYRDSIPG